MAVLNDDLDLHESVQDLVRTALVNEDLQILLDEAQNIKPEDIEIDDLVSAALVGATDIFSWLFKLADFDDNKTIELLKGAAQDQYTFDSVCEMLALNETQREAITTLARENSFLPPFPRSIKMLVNVILNHLGKKEIVTYLGQDDTSQNRLRLFP